MVVLKQPQRGRGRLAGLAAQKNISIVELIRQSMTTSGSMHGAAVSLGVAPNTIRYYLKRAGLTPKASYTVEFELTGEAL